jgi:hypothetical protein
VIGDAFDAVFNEGRTEVDEESQTVIEKAEIGEKLLGMDRSDVFGGFEFEYDAIIDDEVRAEAFIELQAIPFDGDWFLPFDFEPQLGKLTGKNHFIDAFQQTRAEAGVYPVSSVNNLSGEGIEHVTSLRLCVFA